MKTASNILSLLNPSNKAGLITAKGDSISFAELHKKIGEFAGGLIKNRVSEGDRVLILIPMSIELYVALLAVFWIGGTVVLIDPSAPVDKILNRFRPTVFIGSNKAQLLRLKHSALRGLQLYISTGFVPLWHRRMASIKSNPPPIATPKHPALLTFTTGSTGTPKAIARSHQFLLDQHQALSHHMFFEQDDIDMPTLPVFLLHSLAGGATCVLADTDLSKVGSVDPQRAVNQILRESITSMSGSPAFFMPIVRYILEESKPIEIIKRIFTGGARVNSTVLRGLCQAFPKADIYVVYGSTEAEPIAVLDGRIYLDELTEGERTGKGALVGKPVDEIKIWIDNDEIFVSGNHVNPKYYKDNESDSKNKIHCNGLIWHRTGDAGYLDKEGKIWLLGRSKGKVGGHWPMPIEGQAESLSFVKKSGLACVDGKAVLAVEMDDPPSNWRAQLQSIFSNVISIDRIPVDPRHNAKIIRADLNKIVKKRLQNSNRL